MQKTVLTALITSLFVAVPLAAHADSVDSRLQRIKETKILVAAYREMGVPFSYLDRGKPTGFGVELTQKIADGVRRQLNEPKVSIRWNAVTLSTRIPLITTNTVDIECSTTTNTRARQKLVDFSTTFYIADEGMVVERKSGIKQFSDLSGKRVAVAAGSTTENALRQLNADKAANLTILPARNNRVAMQMVQNGQADAYLNGQSIVAGELFRLSDAERFEIVSGGAYKEAFGCMLPKGDIAFKKVVDGVIGEMMQNGEMEALYSKWFIQPIPPFGRGLNLPLNAETRALYQAPNDQPLE